MTILNKFTPTARQAVVQAGIEAAQARIDAAGDGQVLLGPEFLLLALADRRPLAGRPEGLGISSAAIRTEIAQRCARPGHPSRMNDDDLLATLGINAREVRRRAFAGVGVRPDDPSRWVLHRSRLRPLHLVLHGPATAAVLTGDSRKVIEVATWCSRRGHRPYATREDLLWGLLSDYSPAVRILHRLNLNIPTLWTDLQTWSASTS